VVGLNGGILLYTPDICDWEFLDEMAKRYLLDIGRPWWLEQTCWALLAGRTDSKGVFDGRDVRNISGLKKRTPKEIKSNVTKWIGSSDTYEKESTIRRLVEGSRVLHFAGPGKRLMKELELEKNKSSNSKVLRWNKTDSANIIERFLLSMRMFYNNISE
jgi:hypothetical protein